MGYCWVLQWLFCHNNSSLQLVNMSKALESATPVVTALISHHLRFSPLYTRCLVAVLTGLYIHINVIVCGLFKFKTISGLFACQWLHQFTWQLILYSVHLNENPDVEQPRMVPPYERSSRTLPVDLATPTFTSGCSHALHWTHIICANTWWGQIFDWSFTCELAMM